MTGAAPNNTTMFRQIAENVARIREEIAAAAHDAGRSPDDVALMAVTKTRTPEEVEAVVAAGVTLLGENRVQEARDKMPQVRADARWHLVGHLQSNKARQALGLFSTIQSLDSAKLARRLDGIAAEMARDVDVLIEVNTSGEQTKSGVEPEEALDLAGMANECKRLRLRGFMTVGALSDAEPRVRFCFVRLRTIRDEAMRTLSINLPVLSMGMTADFRWAVAEGSTMVRIGTAIFGPRL